MLTFRALTEDLNLTPVSGHVRGSNPGGVHADGAGEKYYIKHYRNPDQSRVEALTASIYDHMGIKTVSPVHTRVNGQPALLAKWNPHLEQIDAHHFEKLTHPQQYQIGKMYHAAVLTKNWDIVGLVHDNIVRHKHDGDLYSVDQGGAFHFRAQGSAKPYGPDIEEHDSLRNNHRASGHVFSTVFRQNPGAEHVGLESVRSMDMDHVKHLFRRSGLSNWRDLHQNFTARREALLHHYS
jgi:hypothetical protein